MSVWENRATPASAILRSGAVPEKVSASTANDSDSLSVSSPLMVAPRSPSASGSW
ncbi:hypothetical protein MKAN_23020 [Mycobacterium kansasii ATCC 12478]|uniref:Uncharacterized protein n=1 Tax=Mycobacterium kansasii ATCC 12478 TaxID=557599 RepID=U5X256_MYCKA|nr:hypothetical protein MKAN_23020 [Mycobacterium kansasii ATCC 12478]